WHCHVRNNLISQLCFLPSTRRAELGHREKVEDIIAFLDLQRYRDTLIANLPYGVRKVVELGRALCVEPKLLLLDEPSSGLNVEETEGMAFWIEDIKKDLGITVIMVEHDMKLVSADPERGEVRFEGKDIARVAPDAVMRQGICHVPEGREIFPFLTVQENLRMGAFTRRDSDGIAKDMEMCFGYFPVLRERASQRAGLLSGGEQQMLAISRALMGRPKLLLLDEPSLGLSPILVTQIFGIIKRINQEQGVSILLVEQNAYIALKT